MSGRHVSDAEIDEPASTSDLDFIAAARDYLPRLTDEIAVLRRHCER